MAQKKLIFLLKMYFVALLQSGKVTESLLYFSSTFFIINKLVLITTCPVHYQAYTIL